MHHGIRARTNCITRARMYLSLQEKNLALNDATETKKPNPNQKKKKFFVLRLKNCNIKLYQEVFFYLYTID